MGFFDFFSSRKLSDVLNETFKIKVHGVKFVIRKLDTMAFMAGYKAILQPYTTYEADKKNKSAEKLLEQSLDSTKKIKDHFRDVFLYSVVEPKLVSKKEENGIWVDHLFTDWDLASELYEKIMAVTYGKKKMNRLRSLKID